jgi:hypothetical protein
LQCDARLQGFRRRPEDHRADLFQEAIVLVFVYSAWEWGKDDKILKARLRHRQYHHLKESEVGGDGQDYGARHFEFDPSILDMLPAAKRISSDFENDDDDDSMEFETPRIGEAIAALKFCEENKGGAAAPPAAEPPPARPSRDRE